MRFFIFLAKQGWEMLNQPENVWIKLMKAKYLKNNMNFLQCKKPSMASTAWKHILDHRCLIRKGLIWNLGN